MKNKMRFFGVEKANKLEKHIKLAFFQGNNKFLYQIRIKYPKTAENLIEIMEYARKELNEIRQLLLDKKKTIERLCFNNNINFNNICFEEIRFEIRNLPKRI